MNDASMPLGRDRRLQDAPSQEIPAIGKAVIFDAPTRTYEGYYNSNVVAFARTQSEAQRRLDDYVYELARRGLA